MTHRFTVQHALPDTCLDDVRKHMADPEFHTTICRKVPSENLVILESKLAGTRYTLKRQHNLDVNIPDIAKRLLSGAFLLWRDDEWDIDNLTARASFRMNLPAAFRCQTRIRESGSSVLIKHDWEVDIHVPLIHGILARHAETEIRRFNQIELDVIRDEVRLRQQDAGRP